MICPACRENMIVVEQRGIELDYCVKCAGVWFDAEELDLLLHSFSADSLSLTMSNMPERDERAAREEARKCPLCRKKMEKILIGQKPEVVIDRCVNGEGLWFDAHEVAQVVGQSVKTPEGSRDKVAAFLGEVFQPSTK